MEVKAIGIIHSPFLHTDGVPIQPAFADDSKGTVEVFPEYEDALADLEGFERIWLLYWFDRGSAFKAKVKPYMDSRTHGLFATRAPARPNPIGLSCVKLVSVERNRLGVAGIDILDGTPLLDIKPYASKFDCFAVQRNGWLDTTTQGTTESDSRFSDEKGKGTAE